MTRSYGRVNKVAGRRAESRAETLRRKHERRIKYGV